MKTFRERKHWLALLAIVFVFAACKGDTPTAPPPGGGNPPGQNPPPTGVTVTLTTSNATPLIDSDSVITATVTENGQPVPNGTAVEFETNHGLFKGVDAQQTIRTTTGGVATVTLTAGSPGTATVTAVVNNVSRTATVTFRTRPTTDPPPSTAPTITSINPTVGRPAGGEVVRIVGTNFRAPVRVLFDTGSATPKEAFVVSVSPTVIEVITPGVDLGVGQQLASQVTVLTEAGTANEQRVQTTFTFRAEVLTPRVTTVSPNTAPINGGTRVTIFGDGFQAPVQVLFGAAEARVIDVRFDQIIVQAPPGRDTSPGASDPTTGPIDITIVNINSATRVTADDLFRYAPKLVITAAGPTEGPASGGTRVTIEGTGFDDPVAVVIGGVAAQPIFVSGTRIIAITSPVFVEGCNDVPGPISVTNIENGDGDEGPEFTYRVPQPAIIAITPGVQTVGGTIVVTVANAPAGANKFLLGSKTVFPSGEVLNPDGSRSFSIVIPNTFQFETEACTLGGVTGEREVPLDVDVTYTNLDTGCTDTAAEALRINPLSTNCVLPPPAEVTQVAPVAGCANAGSVSQTDPATGSTAISFRNDGGQPLQVSLTNVTGANATDFSVTPGNVTVEPGSTGTFTVTFNPSAAGSRSATASFATNDADEAVINVCLQGNGT